MDTLKKAIEAYRKLEQQYNDARQYNHTTDEAARLYIKLCKAKERLQKLQDGIKL